MPGDNTHAWQVMHPPLQPWCSEWLEVGEGHRVYFEQCGHPGAPAALFLHGGPGAGCTADDRRWFNPQRWRVVLMDQRGAGRSTAADPLHANTTAHLLADIDQLRRHLGIERWMLFGGSWGATLALAYAQVHPQRVSGLVLRGVFMATKAERCWLYGPRGAALRHPAAWQRLCEAAGLQAGQSLLDAMHLRLHGDDELAAHIAARAWWQWEDDLMQAETTGPAPMQTRLADDGAALRSARVGVHYARQAWFLQEGQLFSGAVALQGLPAVIVQGARDLVTPPATARQLQARWPRAQLQLLPAAGHASTQPTMARHLVQATDAIAHAAPARTVALNTTVASPQTAAQTAAHPPEEETSHGREHTER